MFLVNTNQQMWVFVGKQEAALYSLSDTLNFAPCSSLDKDNADDLFFIGKSTPQSMCGCDTHKKEYKCGILIKHIDPISSHLSFHILFTRFIMSFFFVKVDIGQPLLQNIEWSVTYYFMIFLYSFFDVWCNIA